MHRLLLTCHGQKTNLFVLQANFVPSDKMLQMEIKTTIQSNFRNSPISENRIKRGRKKEKNVVILQAVAHSTLYVLFHCCMVLKQCCIRGNQQGKCRNSCVLKVKCLACFYETIRSQNHVS